MGIDAQIQSLEQLSALDSEIKELNERLEKERTEIDGVRAAQAQLETTLAADRISLGEMDKTRGELQQDLRNTSQQIDRSRDRLQRSRNEREVQAAERELDELRKLQRDRDEELSKLVGLCDAARSTIADNETKLAGLIKRLSDSEEGAISRIAQLEAQIAARRAGRVTITTALPNLMLRSYQVMHARGKIPVAKTIDGTCLGCYVGLPPMLFHSLLSRTQFGECPNCHRILWYEPPAVAGEAKAAAGEAKAEGADAGEGDTDAPSPGDAPS